MPYIEHALPISSWHVNAGGHAARCKRQVVPHGKGTGLRTSMRIRVSRSGRGSEENPRQTARCHVHCMRGTQRDMLFHQIGPTCRITTT